MTAVPQRACAQVSSNNFLALARCALLGDFLALSPGFGQSNSDGLLPTLDRLAATTTLERAALAPAHDALDYL